MSALKTIAGTVATKGFGFVATLLIGVMMARVLGVEGKGTVDALVAWSLLLLLLYPSLEEPQLYLLGSRTHAPATYIANGILLSMGFGLIVWLCFEALVTHCPSLFTYRDRVSSEWQSLDMGNLRILVVMSPLVLLQRILCGVLQGLRDMRSFNRAFLIQHTVLFFGVVVAVLFLRAGVFGALIAHVAAIVAGGSWALWACVTHPDVQGGRFHPSWSLMACLVRGGLRLHGGVVAAFVIVESDKLILLRHWGPPALALYASAVALTGHIRKLFLLPVKEVLGSRLPSMRSDPERMAETLTKTCRHTLLVSLVPSVVLLAFGLPILSLLYGAPFREAYGPLIVLIPASLLWTAAVVISFWFIGKDRFLTLTIIGVGVAGLNLVLNLLVVPAFGGLGAALSSCLCYALHLGIFLVIIQRAEGLSWRAFLLPRRADFAVYAPLWHRIRAYLTAR